MNLPSILSLVAFVALIGKLTEAQQAFPCQVNNCKECSYFNTCGLCDDNYILRIDIINGSLPYCAPVNCTIENCEMCLGDNICEKCQSGNYISTDGTCVPGASDIVCQPNCLNCSSSTSCNLCSYGFNPQNGYCIQNVPPQSFSCQVAFFPGLCQICSPQYIVGLEYQCVYSSNMTCEVENCFKCFGASNNCTTCLSSYQLTESGTCEQIECEVSNCMSCSNATTCDQCAQNHLYSETLNTCTLKSYGCNLTNCVSCIGPNICGECDIGYQLQVINSQTWEYQYTVCNPVTASSLNIPPGQYQLCVQYGEILLESTISGYGCLECQEGFISVGGVCVANLQQSNYACNINNCVYCISNNYCGECSEGFAVYSYTGGICVPIYSPIPNCLITSGSQCSRCKEGYVSNGGTCQKINQDITCKLSGCNYCLQNDICAQCMTGYKWMYADKQSNASNDNNNDNSNARRLFVVENEGVDNSTNCTGSDCNNGTDDGNDTDNGNKTDNTTNKDRICVKMCNIENCHQCQNADQCLMCLEGYALQNQNMECVPKSSITYTSSQCSEKYSSKCTSCNMANCTGCASGYSLDSYGSYCCQNVQQNALGCLEYESNCGVSCIRCDNGFINVNGQCVRYPCQIQNCNYCFRSDKCIVCADGYNWNSQNNVCEQYSLQGSNCSQNCIACGENGCEQCLSGYKVYQGYCVCDFQNCLECLGGQICTKCASPLIPSVITNDGGCTPMIMPATLCKVSNCFQCIVQNRCGMCDPGFSLHSNGSCIQNSCSNMTNCALCSASQSFCFLCQPGHIQSLLLGSSCEPLYSNSDYSCEVMGCAICESSSTCQICHETYNLNSNKTCSPSQCTANCMICLHNNACLICDGNFYLTNDFKCQAYPTYSNSSTPVQSCTLDNCLVCNIMEKNTSNSSSVRVPTCSVCDLGYQPTQDSQACQPQLCMTPNCQICLPSLGMSQFLCLICQQGYFLNSYLQCVKYSPEITTSVCEVYNCLYCYQNDLCGHCATGYLPIDGLCQTSEHCGVENCQMCTKNNNCTKCTEGYVITSPMYGDGTTQYFCTPACDVSFCDVCQSASLCVNCTITYELSSDAKSCNCPETYITNSSGYCACPTDYLEFQGRICVQCNIKYCQTCAEANQCSNCTSNFTLTNNQCVCPTSFEIVGSECLCPARTTLFSGSCVSCDIDNCDRCEQSNVCKACKQSFSLNTSSNLCYCETGLTEFENYCYTCDPEQVPYCHVCSANNYCETCFNSFVADNVTGQCLCPGQTTLYKDVSPPQCVQCELNGCLLCKEPNVCSQCMPKFTPNNNICLSCAINNCFFCSSENYCASCKNGLQINSQGNQCITCNVANCALCSSTDVCSTCLDGFQFDMNNQFCVNCSTVQGCSVCSANHVCGVCNTGYNLVSSNGTCNLCSYPCATCNQNGSCATCQAPYSLTANEGSCFTCAVANCASCSSNNLTFCNSCVSGYKNLTNGTCQRVCRTNLCTSCNNPDVCTSCVTGYVPSGSGCLLCANSPICTSCQKTNTSMCLQCNDGYYLINGKCQSCASSNCKKCDNSTCLEFKSSTKQFAIKINNKVVPAVCDPGCDKCSENNPQACITCMEGYSKTSDSFCMPCSSNCRTCKSNAPNSCLSCYSTAYLSKNTCVTCTESSNCLTCDKNNLAVCTSCRYGFKLNANKTCSRGCPNNCLSCEEKGCTLCMEGYSLNRKGTCLPCLSNCRGCSSQANGVCLKCGQGFFLNTQNACSSCPQFCNSCTVSGCTECQSGYTLTATFQCAANCIPPCATCSNTNPRSCQSCVAGYTYDSTQGQCIDVTECLNGVCTVCPLGYLLEGGSCIKCPGSNCARCSNTSSTSCSSCVSGYYLNSNSQCVACPNGCTSCSSSNICQSCQQTYTLPVSPVKDTQICVACQSPCLTCSSTPGTCTSCISSYSLVGWKCVSKFNFGFAVTFSVDPEQFYDNYETFLQQIMQAINATNVNLITMIKILKGSTIANGNVTSDAEPGSAAADEQQASLNELFSSNGEIAGMPTQSASIIVNGDTTNNNDNNNDNNNNDNTNTGSGDIINLGLILGICIPVGIIIIAILIYCLCFRKSSPPSTDYPSGRTLRQEFQMGEVNATE